MWPMTPTNPPDYLAVARTAAVAAGDVLRKLFPKARQVKAKGAT